LKKESKYFIAIIPPSPIYEEALAWKHFFKDNYQSKASLNSPPHITLHMPFLWKEEKEKVLIEKLDAFSNGRSSLTIQLNNFSCFEPRVIFIDVVKTEELAFLQKEMERFCKRTFQLFNADYRDLAFHPHMTLAFRDLKKQVFAQAWGEVKDKPMSGSFIADQFVLLKHNGVSWDVIRAFPFSNNSVSQDFLN
jgi:2'-5' RNA ligase